MKKKNFYKMKLGYLLIIIGISLPLMSLTKIVYEDFSNEMKYEEFINEQVRKDSKEEKRIEEYNRKIRSDENKNIIDPFINDKYSAKYDINVRNSEKVFAYINIPEIGVKLPIRLGASYINLDKGAAHIDGTPLPIGGIGTRSVIAGHRGWYKGNMFLNIKKLKSGDKVYIERNGKKLEYSVINKEIILPNSWEKLKPVEGKDMLTLLTCDPVITTNPKRLLVNCERVKDSKSKHFKKKEKNSDTKNIPKKSSSVLFILKMQRIIVAAGWLIELILILQIIKNK